MASLANLTSEFSCSALPSGAFGSSGKWRIAALLMLLGACGSPQGGGELPTDRTSELTLEEIFRIGDEAAGDTVLFSADVKVAHDSKGRLYVTDRQNPSIRVFSRDGKGIATIGRGGSGPGEFESRPHVYLGSQDTLYALDGGSDRITVFLPDDYTPIRTIDIAGAASFDATSGSFQMFEELLDVTPGGIVISYKTAVIPFMSDLDTPAHMGVKLLGHDGSIISDTLYVLQDLKTVHAGDIRGGITTTQLDFGRAAFFAMSRDNLLYYGRNDSIAISVGAIGGSAHRTITVPHTPVLVTANERNRAIQGPSAELQAQLRSLLPEAKPAYLALVVDDMGRMWLQLSAPEGATDVEWIVVNLDGDIVAATTLPLSVQLQAISGDRAIGILRQEESGASVVVAYSISA